MGHTTRGVFLFMSFFCLLFNFQSLILRIEVIGLRINGAEVGLPQGTTLLAYLQQQGYQLERIAVELNGDILRREQYGAVILQDSDVVEIVSFVGGG